MDVRGFDELTKAGRAARLRVLATDTLRTEFDIEPRRVSLLAAHSFNTMFRADIADSARVAVRVGEVRIHTDGVEEVEAAWLRAIRNETDLAVPTLSVDRHGRHVAAGHHPLVPGPRYCSVMSWVPGRIVRNRFDHSIAHRMGVVQARLHEHAHAYAAPDVPAGLFANRVVYFGDTSKLPRYESDYGAMFVEAIDRVQTHLDDLWRSPPHAPHLLHGDFGPQNVMHYRGVLTPIDFQDLQFGFDLQDVAITICDLRRGYDDESLIDALKAGYRTVRPWPLNDPLLEQALAAARSLNVINLGLNLRRPGLDQFIDRHAALVAGWMSGLATKTPLI
ncbi:MAG TPA: phosphotransferase [Ilumatobacteraceae bacterium]|nr:phosphotransferase [Ilumatobacteraceae bacterium]